MKWIFQNREFIDSVAHHQYDDANPGQSGYLLAPGLRFTGLDLLDCLRNADTVPLLLFSVACEAGITQGWDEHWPRPEVICGIVDAALRVGIRHYVGTHIKIPKQRSARILSQFYRGLEAGDTIGQALRRAGGEAKAKRPEVF